MPTDNIITLMVVGSPILLITFALTFSPNLATEGKLKLRNISFYYESAMLIAITQAVKRQSSNFNFRWNEMLSDLGYGK